KPPDPSPLASPSAQPRHSGPPWFSCGCAPPGARVVPGSGRRRRGATATRSAPRRRRSTEPTTRRKECSPAENQGVSGGATGSVPRSASDAPQPVGVGGWRGRRGRALALSTSSFPQRPHLLVQPEPLLPTDRRIASCLVLRHQRPHLRLRPPL